MIASGVSALPFDDPAGFPAPPAFGPFRVLHQIGSGALGPVFRTFEPQLDKLVAVKAFRLDVVPEVTALLAGGLRRLAATPLEHPAVVKMVDAGREGMTAFLAFEYVAAETLDVTLRREAPTTIDAGLPIIGRVAEAIEAAWAVGLGHGALHPRDIFVGAPAGNGTRGGDEIRVAGFGVVSVLEELRLRVPVRRPYSAPERVEGKAWDIRADVYSLGVIAHELLTGRRPAGPGGQDGELPAGMTPEQWFTVRGVLSAALAMDPDDRFATPMAFVAALTHGDPPEAVVGSERSTEGDVDSPAAEPGLVRRATSEPELHFDIADEEPLESEAESVSEVDAVPVMASPRTRAREPFGGALPTPMPMRAPTPALGRGAMALTVGLTLVGGIALGYWWRGPAVPDVAGMSSATEATDQGPIGTEVSVVGEDATPLPATPTFVPPVSAPSVPESPVSESPALNGRLLVRSVPSGAVVQVNGRARGTTPAVIRDLPFGTYNIAVSRPGYERGTRQMTVSRAVPSGEVTIELKSEGASAPAVGTGWVMVETRPAGATVSIDGRVVGVTPLRVPELAPGRYTVRIELAGRKTVTTPVVVRAGQQTPLRVSLEVG